MARARYRFRGGLEADIESGNLFYDIETGFAETITYAAGTDFPGIWEEDYVELDADGYTQVSSTAPACWCLTASAPAIGETITRDTVDYIIVDHQPNDDGETLLILRKG